MESRGTLIPIASRKILKYQFHSMTGDTDLTVDRCFLWYCSTSWQLSVGCKIYSNMQSKSKTLNKFITTFTLHRGSRRIRFKPWNYSSLFRSLSMLLWESKSQNVFFLFFFLTFLCLKLLSILPTYQECRIIYGRIILCFLRSNLTFSIGFPPLYKRCAAAWLL